MLQQRLTGRGIIVCLLSVFLLFSGCGQKDGDNAGHEAEMSSSSESQPMATRSVESSKPAGRNKPVEPLSVEVLKEFLPEKLAGMDRDDIDTDIMTLMEVQITEAYADYANTSGPGDMQLSITDVTDATGPISMVMTYWATTDVNNGDESEYEKTSTYQGYRAFEEYNHSGPSGSFTVLVANRFLVEVSGSRVTMETLKKAAGQVDLKKLSTAAK